MPNLLKFLIRRLIFALVAFLAITVVLYGVLMLAPVDARAALYMPRGKENYNNMNFIKTVIEQHSLDDPFPVQYFRWLVDLVKGDWGWSPGMREDVLPALVRRAPVTAELLLYSLALYIPLGIVSGALAGWKQGRFADHQFRLAAFIGTSIPPFVLGLMLLAVFYVGLHWFPPGRLDLAQKFVVDSKDFNNVTGLITIDGLLNARLDITFNALRHLVLPVVTLSLAHWATLGRVMRTAMIEELDKDYVIVARGKGLSMRRVVRRHALRNAVVPALNSSALSAASLVTGVFIVEIIFSLKGISAPLTTTTQFYAIAMMPDFAATMGFSVFGVLLVLPLMLILDLVQALIDPRIREVILT